MYDELIKQCRDCIDCLCGECKYEHLQKPGNFVPCMNALLGEAADAIEELMAFARFVAEEIVVDDNEWGNNQNAFPEIACRKLFKLGIVSKDGKMWHYEPPKEV